MIIMILEDIQIALVFRLSNVPDNNLLTHSLYMLFCVIGIMMVIVMEITMVIVIIITVLILIIMIIISNKLPSDLLSS